MSNLGELNKVLFQGPLLVTGHTGFKGSWLILLLEKLGIEWIGISLPPKHNSLYNSIKFNNKQNEYFIDIRDYTRLQKIINKIEPKQVIHLAAQSLDLNSYENPKLTFEVNVMGTLNLMDLLFKNGSVNKIVVATTDKVYKEQRLKKSFKESDALGGKDPYSWSKIGTESVIGAWQQISKTGKFPQIVSVRAGNVIGGGDQSENRLLPDLIKGFMNNSEITIRHPNSTRPWQHVLDPLYGYLLALSNSTKQDAYNFSTNSKSLKVQDVVKMAQNLWGNSPQIKFSENKENLESSNLSLDSSKAAKDLNWKSKWNQKDAITATIKWWKSVANQEMTAQEACFLEIEELLNETK
jgi:CDP-glucose 4,6-dehydratase